MIDVTNEYDVSEEVVEHDSTFQMEEEIAPDNSNDAIHVRSMDGNTYLMDRNTINWEETSNNIGIMYQNLEMLQSALMNQLHAATQSADLATKDTMDMVKPFVNTNSPSFSTSEVGLGMMLTAAIAEQRHRSRQLTHNVILFFIILEVVSVFQSQSYKILLIIEY